MCVGFFVVELFKEKVIGSLGMFFVIRLDVKLTFLSIAFVFNERLHMAERMEVAKNSFSYHSCIVFKGQLL